MQLSNRRRGMGKAEEGFEGFLIRGKFVDYSTKDNWNCRINNGIVDLAPFVDPVSKEFEYWSETKPYSLSYMFNNGLLEYVSTLKGTEDVKDFQYVFYRNIGLKNINLSATNLNNNTSFYASFNRCTNLKTIDLSHIETSQILNYRGIFEGCTALETIKVNFDFRHIEQEYLIELIFQECTALKNIEGTIKNLKVSTNLGFSPLTNDSAMVFINGLTEVATPQTITFSRVTYNTLTPEQIAIAEGKNWIVVCV